jgi:hypothetical protein
MSGSSKIGHGSTRPTAEAIATDNTIILQPRLPAASPEHTRYSASIVVHDETNGSELDFIYSLKFSVALHQNCPTNYSFLLFYPYLSSIPVLITAESSLAQTP